jgi:[acyl-carrier-protein] S-malonyltransferase
MSFGLLFSGQGTQHAAMLPWLDEPTPADHGRSDNEALLRRVEQALQVPSWRQALQDAAWAARNRNAQVLLTGTALAAWARLAPQLPAPAGIAGYSVGELAAFSAAGVFDATTAIALAGRRAAAMDQAAGGAPGGLLAVSGAPEAVIEGWCRAHGCSVAIRIAADAVVVGGLAAALQSLHQHASAQFAKCSALNVAVASHTPALQPAADAFRQVLRATPLTLPMLPLFSNATGDAVHTTAQAAELLSGQIAQTVQWSACLDALHARQPRCVLEIGPGTALATMWNRRHPDVPARSADEFRSTAALLKWMTDRLD